MPQSLTRYRTIVADPPWHYLELFARRGRFGWDYWGDQSLGNVEIGA